MAPADPIPSKPRRALGVFKNWKIALAVTSCATVAVVAVVWAVTQSGCNLAIGGDSGWFDVECREAPPK